MELPLKTIIVESIEKDLNLLVEALYPFDKVISIEKKFTDLELASKALLNESFDLTFLDEELMPYGLIDLVGRQRCGIVVFNFEEKLLTLDKGYRRHGYHCLPKPYPPSNLRSFIRELHLDVQYFSESRRKQAKTNKPLLFKIKSTQILVRQEEIVYIEVNDNYCHIYYLTNSGVEKHIVSKQLKYYVATLNPDMFYKIGSKYLININYFISCVDDRVNLKGSYKGIPISIPLKGKNKKSFLDRFIE